MQLQENATLLLHYIYELSDGDTDEIIKRKNLGNRLGLSDRETKDALKELTKAGMIRYILFRSLAITHIGVAEAKKQIRREEGAALSATATGSAAIAQEEGVAAGAGGAAVGGDVHGPVIIAGAGTQVTVTTQDEDERASVSDKTLDLAKRQPFEPEMILISAGRFLMGSDPSIDQDAEEHELPQHTLYLPNYYLARRLVTNAQYAEFVQSIGYYVPSHWDSDMPPDGREDHPVVRVSWYDASEYCRWLSEVTGRPYRLPSEAEWEKGARGSAGLIFPWGNWWDERRCNAKAAGQEHTTVVGAYPFGASPFGLLDMAGNVWQWTASLWGGSRDVPDSKYPYDPGDGRENLSAGDSIRRVLRGGAFHSSRWNVRCAFRFNDLPSFRSDYVGFRVAVHLSQA